MYQRLNPHWRRSTEWYKVKLWTEKKYLKPHPLYPIFKLNETKNGYNGVKGFQNTKVDPELILHRKIIRKYPGIFNTPILSGFDAENPIRQFTNHPLYQFVGKYKNYVNEGFTEEKSFELTERDMSRVLQKEKFEKNIIEGLATSNRARSLMTEYDQSAEYEARQKIKQIQREEGRYQRYENDLEQNLENINNEKIINVDFNKVTDTNKNYEPATCKYFIIEIYIQFFL